MTGPLKRYVIVAPEYVSTSAGIGALYRLHENLKVAGQKSRIVVPLGGETASNDEIVVYPDCYSGNPLNAKNVVRYLLMYAGYFGQDSDFPESEYMYYYSPDFVLNGRNPGNILSLPIVDEKKFKYQPEGRSGSCYLAVKYKNYFGYQPTNLPPGCVEITNHMDLVKLFKTVKTLITFDNSAINLEAAFCGIDIEYRFNEKFEKPIGFGPGFDLNDPYRSYKEIMERYYDDQLPAFIKRTQEHFKDEDSFGDG